MRTEAATTLLGLCIQRRPVALTVRAPVSKTGCWGFESLQACHCSRVIFETLDDINDV